MVKDDDSLASTPPCAFTRLPDMIATRRKIQEYVPRFAPFIVVSGVRFMRLIYAGIRAEEEKAQMLV